MTSDANRLSYDGLRYKYLTRDDIGCHQLPKDPSSCHQLPKDPSSYNYSQNFPTPIVYDQGIQRQLFYRTLDYQKNNTDRFSLRPNRSNLLDIAERIRQQQEKTSRQEANFNEFLQKRANFTLMEKNEILSVKASYKMRSYSDLFQNKHISKFDCGDNNIRRGVSVATSNESLELLDRTSQFRESIRKGEIASNMNQSQANSIQDTAKINQGYQGTANINRSTTNINIADSINQRTANINQGSTASTNQGTANINIADNINQGRETCLAENSSIADKPNINKDLDIDNRMGDPC